MSDQASIYKKKDELQRKMIKLWVESGHRGMFTLATGVGKTRLGCLAMEELAHCFNEDSPPGEFTQVRVMVGCSREKIRDVVWPEEMVKWGINDPELFSVDLECYASFHNIKGRTYDLVILDEAHNLTENSYDFFVNNQAPAVMILTATPPSDKARLALLTSLAPHLFHYPLDQAVKDGLVSPYEVVVVLTELEAERKTVEVKTKKVSFKTTELARYQYLCKQVEDFKALREAKKKLFYDYQLNLDGNGRTDEELEELSFKSREYKEMVSAGKLYDLKVLERARFIYGLGSKAAVARRILARLPEDLKVIIFSGSIEQAEALAEHTFHSRKKSDKDLLDFMAGTVKRLACVDSLNEGITVDDLDMAVATKISSSDRVFIQRLGRLVRYAEGRRGRIVVIIATDTVEERWAISAMKDMDKDCITIIEEKDVDNFLF